VAAVAYSWNAWHDGDVYRFDGWTRISDNCGHEAGPNSTWSRRRADTNPTRGPKTFWLHRYEIREAR